MSSNPTFAELVAGSRSGAVDCCAARSPPHSCPPWARAPRVGRVGAALTFTPIGPSTEDALRVPPEYEATVLFRWGDPVGAAAGMPEFRLDASNSAADQALQAGMHHDGMHFFPLPAASGGSAHGLLVMNHEYLDEGLLSRTGRGRGAPRRC